MVQHAANAYGCALNMHALAGEGERHSYLPAEFPRISPTTGTFVILVQDADDVSQELHSVQLQP